MHPEPSGFPDWYKKAPEEPGRLTPKNAAGVFPAAQILADGPVSL